MSFGFKFGAMIGRYPKLAVFVAGLLSALGFAPVGFWPITIAAFALLVWLTTQAESRKRAFGLGWAFGLGHFALGLNWIATAFTFQAAMPAWLGWVAVVGLSAYLAIYPALATLGAWMIGRTAWQQGRAFPLLLAFAGCWIITEWLRSWVMTGFAWNPLSAIWAAPHIIPYYASTLLPWLGTYAVSGITAFLAACFVSAPGAVEKRARLDTKSLRNRRIWIAGVIVAVVFLPDLLPSDPETAYRNTPITIIQPNVSQADKWEGDAATTNFAKLAAPTKAATRERIVPMDSRADPDLKNAPRLIFWPEAAIPDYLESGYPLEYYRTGPALARARLASLLGPDDVLVLGALKLEFDKAGLEPVAARNSVMMVNAQGQLLPGRYDKAHLVPGGEYLPMRSLLEPLGLDRLAPGDLEFWPGPGARTLPLTLAATSPDREPATIQMGVQICYEIIFSGQVVDRTKRPDFIFNPSNDAWFGSWGPPQHLAQARLRAIEEGVPIIRATPTGISAVIDAQGHVVNSIGMGKSGRIDAMLPAAAKPTVFSAWGNTLSVAFAVILIFFAIALARRTR